jgi:hypothetical protein
MVRRKIWQNIAKHIQKCSVSQSISVPVLLALASNYFCWIQQTTNQPTRQPLPNSKRIAWKLINSLCRTGCLCCFCCLQLRSKPVSSVSAMFRSLFHDDLCLSLCISCHHALHGTFWHSLRQTNTMKYLFVYHQFLWNNIDRIIIFYESITFITQYSKKPSGYD